MNAETRPGRFAASLFDLSGQVALVTGAGRGLGREMARALASAGATAICAGRDLAMLEQTVAAIAGEGGKAEALGFDIVDSEACQRAIGSIAERHGRLDILVNNAGAVNDPVIGGGVIKGTIMGRWGRPDELCAAVLFLASPGAGFITGQQIVIDGGLVTKA